MEHQLYLEYLEKYALEALNSCNNDVSAAADYLESKAKIPLFTSDKKEKKAALKRVRKVFNESRGRTAYLVLKSLGLDDLARSRL